MTTLNLIRFPVEIPEILTVCCLRVLNTIPVITRRNLINKYDKINNIARNIIMGLKHGCLKNLQVNL